MHAAMMMKAASMLAIPRPSVTSHTPQEMGALHGPVEDSVDGNCKDPLAFPTSSSSHIKCWDTYKGNRDQVQYHEDTQSV